MTKLAAISTLILCLTIAFPSALASGWTNSTFVTSTPLLVNLTGNASLYLSGDPLSGTPSIYWLEGNSPNGVRISYSAASNALGFYDNGDNTLFMAMDRDDDSVSVAGSMSLGSGPETAEMIFNPSTRWFEFNRLGNTEGFMFKGPVNSTHPISAPSVCIAGDCRSSWPIQSAQPVQINLISTQTFVNQPRTESFTTFQVMLNLTSYSEFRIYGRQVAAGVSGYKYYLKYHVSNPNAGITSMTNLSNSNQALTLGSSLTWMNTAWTQIRPGARNGQYVHLFVVTQGGNSAADPAIRNLVLEIR